MRGMLAVQLYMKSLIFQKIGTISAGFAYSLGYPDGEKIDFEYIVQSVQQIQNENKISKLLNHDFSYEIANRIFSC